jgi:hypothetical protein
MHHGFMGIGNEGVKGDGLKKGGIDIPPVIH